MSHDFSIYTPVLKGPRVCNTTKQGHHQASGTMKTKELSKQVREKYVEKYRSGLSYKKISESLNKPAKRGPPTKTHGPGKEGINQRGNKETKDNPEGAAKLHSGDWSICP